MKRTGVFATEEEMKEIAGRHEEARRVAEERAPDSEKLRAYIGEIAALADNPPDCATDLGRKLCVQIQGNLRGGAAWATARVAGLTSI